MSGHHGSVRVRATLTVAFVLVGCAGGAGQSATPTLPTPTPTATATATSPATLEPTTLPTPTATLDRLGAAWRGVTNPPPHEGDPGITVAAGGQGWLALATAGDGGAPTAWTSVDGFAWQQVATLPLPAGLDVNTVTAMTTFETNGYGLGTTWLADGSGVGAIVWRSKDEGAWEVIGSSEIFDLGPCPAGCASLSSIAVGAGAVVVAGYRVEPVGDRFALETDLWSTLDGMVWVRVPAPVPAGSTDEPAAEIAVAAGGPGFVAAGSLCSADGRTCRAVTWSSTDGRSWALPVDLPGGSGVRGQQVAIGPGGAVVLGMRCTEAAGCGLVAWRSDDGVAWEPADLAGTYVEGSTELAVAGDAFLLVTTTDAGAASAWTSTDGRHWASEAVEPGLDPDRPLLQILGVAGRPGGALAVGLGEEEQGGLWVSP